MALVVASADAHLVAHPVFVLHGFWVYSYFPGSWLLGGLVRSSSCTHAQTDVGNCWRNQLCTCSRNQVTVTNSEVTGLMISLDITAFPWVCWILVPFHGYQRTLFMWMMSCQTHRTGMAKVDIWLAKDRSRHERCIVVRPREWGASHLPCASAPAEVLACHKWQAL